MLACVALAIIAFVLAVFGGDADNAVIQAYDVREDFIYKREYLRTALQDGRLPLWNPHTFGGAPFLANPQAQVFYPGSLLFLWLPRAPIIELVFHLLLAGTGIYALARISYGISRGSAVLAALTFCMTGTIFGHVFRGHPHIINAIAYIPLLALAVERAATSLAVARQDQPGRSRPRFGTIATALRRTLTCVGAWPWLAGLLLALQLLTGSLQIVWLGMLFIGLSRLLHLLLDARANLRAWLHEGLLLLAVSLIGVGLAAVQLLPTWELSQLSTRAAQDYAYSSTASFSPDLTLTMFHPRAAPGGEIAPGGNFGYAGLLTALLALLSLFCTLRDRRVAILWISAGFFFLLMFGRHSSLFPLLYKFVPSFDFFRAPARAITIVHLAMSLLAAAGLDVIIRQLPSIKGQLRWLAPTLVAVICAITWIDLVSAARWQKQAIVFPELQRLDDPAQLTHAGILEKDQAWYRYWFYPNALRDNHAFAMKARSIGGYDVMILARYERFIRTMTDSANAPSGLTRLSAASYLNSPSPFPFKVLGTKYADYGGRLVRNVDPRAVTRAWFVTRSQTVSNEEAALSYMRSDDFERYREVVFEADESRWLGDFSDETGAETSPPDKIAAVIEVLPEKLIIRVDPHPPGYLVLSEIYYPGWRASIGDAEIPIYRCNSILRCLKLDTNVEPKEISMEFNPPILRWGAMISGLSLIVVAAGLWFGRRREELQ
jgi:hypothetical protein